MSLWKQPVALNRGSVYWPTFELKHSGSNESSDYIRICLEAKIPFRRHAVCVCEWEMSFLPLISPWLGCGTKEQDTGTGQSASPCLVGGLWSLSSGSKNRCNVILWRKLGRYQWYQRSRIHTDWYRDRFICRILIHIHIRTYGSTTVCLNAYHLYCICMPYTTCKGILA